MEGSKASRYALDLVTVGSSLSVNLPEDLVTELNAEAGGQLFWIKTPEGFLVTTDPGPITPNAETVAAMEASRRGDFEGSFSSVDGLFEYLHADD